MGKDVGGAKGGLKADINVTPLVDVMLVLLIIMMLIAPMLQKGVDVKLPLASNSADKPETQDQTVVAITADKRMFLNGIPIREDDLRTQIEAVLENKKEKIVLIKADEDAPYGSIMSAMDRLREAQIENIGLVTERKISREVGGQ
jgi:biopolymer transport protein ExbD